jgi:hypothetical protein
VLVNASFWPWFVCCQVWGPYLNPCWTSRLPLPKVSWCDVTSPWCGLKIFSYQIHVATLSIQSLIGISVFAFEVCLSHLQPFQVSGCLSVLIPCCCPTWPDLMLIFHLVITLVDANRAWKLSKSPLLSCLRQLSYVLLCCVLILGSPLCWLLPM